MLVFLIYVLWIVLSAIFVMFAGTVYTIARDASRRNRS